MDVLEKALLVDELKHLIVGLNDDKTSHFEIAKSKQRIKDICASCDDPVFQDQPFWEGQRQQVLLPKDPDASGVACRGHGGLAGPNR